MTAAGAAPGGGRLAAATGTASARKRVAGLVWGCAGAGVLGGFLAGALAGGGFDDGAEDLSDIIEVLTGAPVAAFGSLALAWQIGTRVRLSAPARYGVALAAIVGAFLIGFSGAPEMADEGPDDMSAWLGSTEGVLGLALLAVALLLATALSFRRFRTWGPPPPEPTLEQRLYGPGG